MADINFEIGKPCCFKRMLQSLSGHPDEDWRLPPWWRLIETLARFSNLRVGIRELSFPFMYTDCDWTVIGCFHITSTEGCKLPFFLYTQSWFCKFRPVKLISVALEGCVFRDWWQQQHPGTILHTDYMTWRTLNDWSLLESVKVFGVNLYF